MSFVHNMHIGGDIKEAFALISVEYPSGSHCTCSNGTKTLTATDASGEYIFPIPEAGTWTVRAYDGPTWETSDNKASQIINIATQYQIENVTLSYELYIIKNGRFQVPYAVGRNNYNSPITATSYSGRQCIKFGARNAGSDIAGVNAFTIAPTVELGGFSTLKMEIQSTYNQTAYVGVYSTNDATGAFISRQSCGQNVQGSITSYAVPINSLETGYIGAYFNSGHNYMIANIFFYNLWLE